MFVSVTECENLTISQRFLGSPRGAHNQLSLTTSLEALPHHLAFWTLCFLGPRKGISPEVERLALASVVPAGDGDGGSQYLGPCQDVGFELLCQHLHNVGMAAFSCNMQGGSIHLERGEKSQNTVRESWITAVLTLTLNLTFRDSYGHYLMIDYTSTLHLIPLSASMLHNCCTILQCFNIYKCWTIRLTSTNRLVD